MTDAELLRQFVQNRDQGMELLLRQFTPLLRYVISGVLRDTQDAEDCFSEVSLALWQKLDGFDPEKGSLSAWLTAIARNAAMNHLKARLRREKHQPEEPPGVLTPEQEVLRRKRAEQLRDTVANLSDLDRKIFYRRYYYLQPIGQIAAELGLSQRAVEGRLYRLRQRLRQELGGDDA